MKEIMIVDDEFIVRLGIRSLISWEANGMQIVCEAANGKEAIEKIPLHEPKIILTDLVMGPVDGLELIEYCNEKHPDIKFIVLSNYNDIDKVKLAMKLGAYDYIFKLSLNPDHLLGVLRGAAKEIDEKQVLLPSKSASRLLGRNAVAIRRHLIGIMIEQSYLRGEDILAELRLIGCGVNFDEPFLLLYLRVNNLECMQKGNNVIESNLFAASFENVAMELFGEDWNAQMFQCDNSNFLIVVNTGMDTGQLQPLMERYSLLSAFAGRYLGVTISAACHTGLRGPESVKSAVACCREALLGSFHREDNSPLLLPRESQTAQAPASCPPFDKGPLLGCLNRGDLAGARDQIDAYIRSLHELERADPYPLRESLYALYLLIKEEPQSRGIQPDLLTDRYGLPLGEAILQYDRLTDIARSFHDFFDWCELRYGAYFQRKKPRSEIAFLCSYIRQHYREPIDMELAAGLLHFNESYLSHLFKKETGVSFVDYLSQVRVDKAKELLRATDLKINDIAKAVGVDNPNYFYSLFKKIVGHSPSSFRNDIRLGEPSKKMMNFQK